MNVLVLGGTGYLGSKLVRRLLSDGHNVVCTKRYNSDISTLNGLDVIWTDASADGVSKVYSFLKIDAVINMVCDYGRNNVLYDKILLANLEFPTMVLNLAADNGTDTFITMGTGLPDKFNMYSFSKYLFSELGKYYSDNNNVNFLELKLEMFYGADEPDSRFLPSVIRNMLAGSEVDTTLGTQHRDIIAAEDIIFAIVSVLNAELKGYNKIPVGTGIAPSISEVIDFIHTQTGKRTNWNKGAIPMRKNEPDCIADTSVIKTICEWNPTPWKDGISQMIMEIKNDGGIKK